MSVDAFIEIEKAHGFNDKQIAYVKEVLLFISRNGKFERTDLLKEELNFNGVFNSQEIGCLKKDFRKQFYDNTKHFLVQGNWFSIRAVCN